MDRHFLEDNNPPTHTHKLLLSLWRMELSPPPHWKELRRVSEKLATHSTFFSLAPPCSADTPRNYFFIGLEAFFFILFMVLAFMLAFMLFGFFPIGVEWWVGDASLLIHLSQNG